MRPSVFDRLVRPTLYQTHGGDAERVHERTLALLAGAGRTAAGAQALEQVRRRTLVPDPVRVFGIDFPNRVGLAAGMDKNGRALPAWGALGFGHVEVGTVTARPQPGNDRPRMFALDASDGVLNRMGFNNEGADALARRLQQARPGYPIGISLGKSKVTPLAQATEDYLTSLRQLHRYADYVAINVSSPNTPGLRSLQDGAALDELLQALVGETRSLAAAGGRAPVPVLVKVAPDLTDAALAELLAVCVDRGVAGIIATNTTLARDGLAPADAHLGGEPGGVSGAPLRARALEVVRFVARESGPALPIIGVGGIGAPEHARAMLDAGASLVQVYSALALHGPGVVHRTARGLAADPALG